jgi:hypothetical protein
MKKSMLFVAIVLMAGITLNLNAQNSASTDAGAKIVSALTLTKTTNLHFGTMAIPTGATNLVLATDGSRTPTVPANITLLSQAPLATNAAYTVAGSATSTYAITLPASVTIVSGGNNMTVSDFVAKPASKPANSLTGTLDLSGADSFVVGATLQLSNAQAAGVYSGTFNVSVNYN